MTTPRTRTAGAAAAGLALLFAAAASAIPSPQAQERPAEETTATRSGSLGKSLLLPGWGQFAEKHPVEGAIFLGAELACLAAALWNDRRGNDSYRRYQAATTADEAVRSRELTVRYDSRRNQWLLAGAAVWALNLLDVYLIVARKEGEAKTLSLGVAHAGRGEVRLRLSCRF